MKKTIFLGNLTKFFEERSLRSDEKKILSKIAKKMVFSISKVILFFNDLCPFLIFKLIIIKKFELRQKLKCAQTLVLYSSSSVFFCLVTDSA